MSYRSLENLCKVTRLTNLEKINISGVESSHIDWRIIKSLPKLLELKDHSDRSASFGFDQIQWTQLTALFLESRIQNDEISTSHLSNLTNLRHLKFKNCFYEPLDFSGFTKLTYLEMGSPRNTVYWMNLPSSLKTLSIGGIPNSSLLDHIFKLDGLESLAIRGKPQGDWTEELSNITKLTNLRCLRLFQELPKGKIKYEPKNLP